MNNAAKKNPAVTPVIGTILLVAITVILVVIIVSVVMNLGNTDDGKKVGLNAQPKNTGGNDAQLILYGGASLDELVMLEMIDHDSPIGEYVQVWNISSGYINVGLPYTAKDVAKPVYSSEIYDTRINVRGTFADGTDVVLLIQPVTFGNVKGQPSSLSEFFAYFNIGTVNILENEGKTIQLPQTQGWHHTTTMGDAAWPLFSLKMANSLPENYDHWEITAESQAEGRDEERGPISVSRTGTTKAGNTYTAQASERISVTMGVYDGRGGPWRYTVTIYGKDGSVLASDSVTLTTPLTGGAPAGQSVWG